MTSSHQERLMSLETQRRFILSEWRIVMVSQTSYPIMYKIDRPQRSTEASRSLTVNYAEVKIPLGNRIMTKWQEQVRPIENETNPSESDNQWHVVREWTEAEIYLVLSGTKNMAAARNFNLRAEDSDQETTVNRVKDRTQIQRVLTEVGLNPKDYIFSPLPDTSPAPESTSNYPSAFSSYPAQQRPATQKILKPRSHSLFTSARPISYVDQPPPPPPPPQPPTTQQPLPPPPPPSNTNQAFASSQAPSNQQQGSSSQPGPSLLSRLFNPSASNTQNAPSQPPNDMNRQAFSPRRSPPPPPSHSNLHPHETNLSAEHYLRQINSHDNPPVKVVKPSTQNVVYKKEIRIRYLQPPTPPPPAPIIIREKHIPPNPPQSPLLIRERKPDARTPPPLTIRERPPTPPAPLEPYIIEKNLPPAPPQPRQIIIERLPTPPPKPRTVIFEKWLPYKKVKRPVLLQKAPTPEPVKPTRNVVIEYEPLKAFTVRRVIEEGVFRVDPHQYASYNAQSHSGAGDVRIVERIEDLPPPSEQLMRVLKEYNHSHQHDTSHTNRYDHQSHQNLSEHIPSTIQHLLTGARPVSNADQLTNVSRSSNTPAHRQERVLSTGTNSSITSPVNEPLQPSRSKTSNVPLQRHTSRDTSMRSYEDDIY